MSLLKNANLTLAFFLELVALGAFAYFGFTATDSSILNIILAIGITVIAIVLWGLFAAPRSERRLQGSTLILFKVIFFTLACAALFAANNPALSVLLGVLAAINLVLAYVWKQETL